MTRASARAVLLREYVAQCLRKYFEGGFRVDAAGEIPLLTCPYAMRSRAAFREAWHKRAEHPPPPPPPSSNARVYTQTDEDTIESAAERGRWLTPSGLFAPFYGHAVRERLRVAGVTEVVEVGAGRGCLAASVLDGNAELRSYVTLEQSTDLRAAQKARLGADPRVRVLEGDCLDAKAWTRVASILQSMRDDHQRRRWATVKGNSSVGRGGGYRATGNVAGGKTAIVMLEVLDNLPHDRVVRDPTTGEWLETYVGRDGAGRLHEVEEVISDATIRSCLSCYTSMEEESKHALLGVAPSQLASSVIAGMRAFIGAAGVGDYRRGCGGSSPVFLPTGFELALDGIVRAPMGSDVSLLIADFSSLPDVLIEGENAPLVAGARSDMATYLDSRCEKGHADILFPTNFALIEHMIREHAGDAASVDQGGHNGLRHRAVQVNSSQHFLARYLPPASIAATTCADGYNPLLEEYLNTKVLYADL